MKKVLTMVMVVALAGTTVFAQTAPAAKPAQTTSAKKETPHSTAPASTASTAKHDEHHASKSKHSTKHEKAEATKKSETPK